MDKEVTRAAHLAVELVDSPVQEAQEELEGEAVQVAEEVEEVDKEASKVDEEVFRVDEVEYKAAVGVSQVVVGVSQVAVGVGGTELAVVVAPHLALQVNLATVQPAKETPETTTTTTVLQSARSSRAMVRQALMVASLPSTATPERADSWTPPRSRKSTLSKSSKTLRLKQGQRFSKVNISVG